MIYRETDYAATGSTIQQAMVADKKANPTKLAVPRTIKWGKHRVQSSDVLQVPTAGIVRIEFLTPERDIRQGIDLKLDGWIELPNRDRVPLLRTWLDPRFEDQLEYPYFSREGILRTWNVYEMAYPGGQKVEDKWTGNAGFWVEVKSACERVYHCSHGAAGIPDFEAMAYRLTVKSPDAGSVA